MCAARCWDEFSCGVVPSWPKVRSRVLCYRELKPRSPENLRAEFYLELEVLGLDHMQAMHQREECCGGQRAEEIRRSNRSARSSRFHLADDITQLAIRSDMDVGASRLE